MNGPNPAFSQQNKNRGESGIVDLSCTRTSQADDETGVIPFRCGRRNAIAEWLLQLPPTAITQQTKKRNY
jgi:hypothetical protein